MSPKEAVAIANQKGKDLIEVVPNAQPPVCKIMDFGKYKYEIQKKERLQKKHQHVSHLKELRFNPNIGEHDFEFKVKHAIQFLEDGDKVKASVLFKGREITYKEQGEEILNKLTEKLAEVAKIDQPLHMEGKNMIIIYVPDKTAKPKTKVETKIEPKTESKTETKKQ